MRNYCCGWEARSHSLVYIIRMDFYHALGEIVVAFSQRDRRESKEACTTKMRKQHARHLRVIADINLVILVIGKWSLVLRVVLKVLLCIRGVTEVARLPGASTTLKVQVFLVRTKVQFRHPGKILTFYPSWFKRHDKT